MAAHPYLRRRVLTPLCDGVVDVYGDHCITCVGGGDRTKRHNLLGNSTFHMCAAVGLNPELEKPGLLRPRPLLGSLGEDGRQPGGPLGPEGRRPADVYLPRWRGGTPAALDFAATSGLRTELLLDSAADPTSAVVQYEGYKETFLDTKAHCLSEGITFIPMIVDACGGGWGPQACRVWTELAKTTALATGELPSTEAMRVLQSLSLILRRENARAVLRRSPEMESSLSQIAPAGVCDSAVCAYACVWMWVRLWGWVGVRSRACGVWVWHQ